MLNLRSEKIAKQPEPEVQIALRNWTLARLQMRGYQAILLSEAATPIGYVCWFNAEGLTRLRDLFIKEDYQQRRLSKYLLTRVMAMQKAPFGVITSTFNKARYTYNARGFAPVFAEEAYELRWHESSSNTR